MTSQETPEDCSSEEEEDHADTKAWVAYAAELAREAAQARVPDAESETYYIEYPHSDPAVQLARVTRFLEDDAAWLAEVNRDDEPGGDGPNAYTLPPASPGDVNARERLYRACVFLERAHPDACLASCVGGTSIVMSKESMRHPQSAVLRFIKRMPYLWVWGASGPDFEGSYYLIVTTKPAVFHAQQLKRIRGQTTTTEASM